MSGVRATHFVALRCNDSDLVERLEKDLRERLDFLGLGKCFAIQPSTYHISLLVCSLGNKQEEEKACEAVKVSINKSEWNSSMRLRWNSKYQTFGNKVLFLSPTVADVEKLVQFNAILRSEFQSRGIAIVEPPANITFGEATKPFIPHLTLFKSSAVRRSKWTNLSEEDTIALKRRQLPVQLINLSKTADLSEVLADVTQQVSSIELCKIQGRKSTDPYYPIVISAVLEKSNSIAEKTSLNDNKGENE